MTWDRQGPKGIYVTTDEQRKAIAQKQAQIDSLRAGCDDIQAEDPRIGRAFQAVAAGNQAHLVYQFLKDYFTGRQQQLDHQLFEAPEEEWPSIVRTKREIHLLVRNLMALIEAGAGSARVLQPLMELRSE